MNGAAQAAPPRRVRVAWSVLWLVIKLVAIILLCLSVSGPPRLVYQGF